MKDIRTTLDFSDGEIFETQKYDRRAMAAATLEKVKFFLSDYITEHRLSGSASIGGRRGRVRPHRPPYPAKARWAGELDRMLSEKYHAHIKRDMTEK